MARAALCAVAARGSEATFASKLAKVFGADVPVAAYQALRKALLGRTLVTHGAPEALLAKVRGTLQDIEGLA